MDRFDGNNVHFLDIAIDKIDTVLYYKPTHAGQYSSFNCSLLWNYTTTWIKSLYHRAKKICSSKEKFKCQIDKIRLFISWNGYPSYPSNSIIKWLVLTLVQTQTEVKGQMTRRKFSGLDYLILDK